MILLKETTVWDQKSQPNHCYLLSDDKCKMVGYIKKGTKELKIFSKELTFDKRRRTFKVIKKNLSFNKI
tara:strand:- start:1061 stop:1267 length:207 start_codon:yes stop_codon:yes gene_type:complete